jgi:hypothetical protein
MFKVFKIRKITIIRTLLSFVFSLCLIIFLFKYLNFFIAPSKVICNFTKIYSQEQKNEILTFIKGYFNSKKSGILVGKTFTEQLRTTSKIINKISWNIELPNSIFLSIEGVSPLCSINDLYVIDENMEIFNKAFFEEYNLSKLPKILIKSLFNIKSGQECSSSVKDLIIYFLNERLSFLRQKYLISYSSPFCYNLIPCDGSIGYIIKINKSVFLSEKKLFMISSLYKDLLHRGLLKFSKKSKNVYNNLVVFDARFDGCIVAKSCSFSLKKGGVYEK